MTAPALRSPLSERDFLRQVVELAEIRGWAWLHIRPGMTRDSWRTPISGPLGKGWPDLVLCRGNLPGREDYWGASRILAVELKREGGTTTPEQDAVLAALQEAGMEAYVWRPSNWASIEKVLR